ncbi:MAG: DUF4271 domain-containing protein [Cyclobacteriaceae bacterium]|nr:DUF4271 domain-containing protein [Cyclobacteriaceae bacterium]
MMRIIFLAVNFLLMNVGFAQDYFIKMDLQADWLVFSDGAFREFKDNDQVKAIHIRLNPSRYRGDQLLVESEDWFSVFINDELITDNVKYLALPIDSIQHRSALISLVGDRSIKRKNQKTLIITASSSTTIPGPVVRPKNDSRNFVIAAGLLLIVLLAFMLRLNPKLTLSYFSLSRLFSLRESDEGQSLARIGSSANLLFYLFASLSVGFVIMVIVIGVDPQYRIQYLLKGQSFVELSIRWLQLSGGVAVAIFLKAILITMMSILFGINDQSGFQFLGFIRSIMLITVLFTGAIVFYFILNGSHEPWYSFSYASLRWLMTAWIILIFLKLMRRTPFSVFHLFSYICATELIPFFVAVKLLYE